MFAILIVVMLGAAGMAVDLAWTHPMCNHCWLRIKGPTLPNRSDEKEMERCCFCDRDTDSGIYVRLEPRLVHGV